MLKLWVVPSLAAIEAFVDPSLSPEKMIFAPSVRLVAPAWFSMVTV